ncbi:hypothetical protein MC885_007635 [Smutsia gigantea]|nr:hypothetical protein MC885_007635 [Smutsia gigantea]
MLDHCVVWCFGRRQKVPLQFIPAQLLLPVSSLPWDEPAPKGTCSSSRESHAIVLVVISECFSVPLPRHLSEGSEQNQRSEEAQRAEQLQDAEEEKDDSNEEENKDSLIDDDEEKEDLGDEDEGEEEEEEDSPAAGVDEERNDAQEDVGPDETKEAAPEQPRSAGPEVAGDTLRQRKSPNADRDHQPNDSIS